MPISPDAIDPELAAPLAAMPRGADGGSMLDLTDIPALRAQVAEMTAAMPVPPPDPRVDVTTTTVARPDGTALDVVLFRPEAADGARPALLWFHAGGQVLGAANEDAAYHAALALTLDCTVAVVDYRLAPETQAPGGAEDGALAFAHLTALAARLDVDPDRIGIAGASGGGAPAAAAALMIRDRRLGSPRLLALSYAMLDDRNETPSSNEVTDVGVWDRRENLLAWRAVLGDRAGSAELDPYSAPGRAEDLRGMPPAFVAAAEYDVFRDEDIAFAQRLMTAQVPTELHVYPGAFHAWDRFAPGTRLATAFERDWHDFIRRHLHG